MKVLITGAGGNLGRVLAPALEEKGYEPILLDYRKIETPYQFVQGDARNLDVLIQASKNVDAIVHGAALHGIHLNKYSSTDYWELNVTGTHYVYQAALENGISKVLLCSTMGVYGEGVPFKEDAYSEVVEDLPLLPKDVYGLSKKLCEELGEYYYRNHGIQTIAYRLGMFVPEDFIRYGFRLLKGGVDDRDVAQAFLLGLENEKIGFDAFNIMAEVPFRKEDERGLLSNSSAVIEKYYPGANTIFKQKNIPAGEIMDMWGRAYWSVDKAKKELGYSPQYNFDGYLQALKEDNHEYYPFADLPWWGV